MMRTFLMSSNVKPQDTRFSLLRLSAFKLIIFTSLFCFAHFAAFLSAAFHESGSRSIGYDHRALKLDGQRRFLISGSIHYPRSTPQMWPKLLQLSKEGGVDVIDTYVFWDAHEPVKGKFNFEGRFNLIAFLNAVQNAGLLANLRIGPYICAEWNFGGFPAWLKEIPKIELRTNNEPFKEEMSRFVRIIVDMLKENNLFYPQGGPIILTQVENEYRHVGMYYGDEGKKYTNWAATMASNLNTTVPWTMCSQTEAPEEILITCNGFYCDDFMLVDPGKPRIWTENYPGWFHTWGLSPSYRPVENTAFAVARFFQKGGSMMNYYMYHGGTNFGRTAGRRITTSYDYHAPLDEYGRARLPDWCHFRNLHAALKLCEPAMAATDDEPRHWKAGHSKYLESYVYSDFSGSDDSGSRPDSSLCAAFLSNFGFDDATVELYGKSYHVPAWSVSILPDCKNEVFNTAKVTCQTSRYKMVDLIDSQKVFTSGNTLQAHDSDLSELESGHKYGRAEERGSLQWEWFRDSVRAWGTPLFTNEMLEQYTTTRDTTDYMWYSTNVTLPDDESTLPQKLMIKIQESGRVEQLSPHFLIETKLVQPDLLHIFVNDKLADQTPISNASGFYQPVTLQPGSNSIALLSVSVGLRNGGPFLETVVAGLHGCQITLEGLESGKQDLTHQTWANQAGLKGEDLHLESDSENSPRVSWHSSGSLLVNEPLVWYKAILDRPGGDDSRPLVLDLGSMGKGAVWMNGNHLGRYWALKTNPLTEACFIHCDYRGNVRDLTERCPTQCGQLSQRWYHVPREWMNATKNLLVMFEEVGGNPHQVSLFTSVVHTICSHIFESHPPPARPPSQQALGPELELDCGEGLIIANISFASWGNPGGKCGQFVRGECHAVRSEAAAAEACVGRQQCSISVHRNLAGEDPCPGRKNLSFAVQALCKPVEEKRPA